MADRSRAERAGAVATGRDTAKPWLAPAAPELEVLDVVVVVSAPRPPPRPVKAVIAGTMTVILLGLGTTTSPALPPVGTCRRVVAPVAPAATAASGGAPVPWDAAAEADARDAPPAAAPAAAVKPPAEPAAAAAVEEDEDEEEVVVVEVEGRYPMLRKRGSGGMRAGAEGNATMGSGSREIEPGANAPGTEAVVVIDVSL